MYQGNTLKTLTPDGLHLSRFSCLAFHPLDDNILYLFGGTPGTSSMTRSYTFNDNTLRQLRNLPNPAFSVGCIGYVKPKDNKPVS